MEAKADAKPKITDFFPTSPKQQIESEKDDVIPTPFLTPESTPTKDKSNADKANTKTANVKSSLVSKKVTDEGDHAGSCETPESSTGTREQVVSTPTPDVGSKKKRGRGRGRGRGKKPQAKSKDSDITTEVQPSTTQRMRKTKKEEAPSHQLTEYFQVRRSDRRLKTDFEKQKKQMLEDAIVSGSEDGLKVVELEGKGRGVVSTKPFQRGDFVVEYRGNLIDLSKAKQKEAEYSQDPDVGCYMYYFNYSNKKYCVDATAESGKLGRLLNHSKSGNCKTKVVGIDNRPYLILVAAKDISIGDELLYDYGDRSKEALAAHPWLAL